MFRRPIRPVCLAVLLAVLAAPLHAQTVDTAGAGALIAEAMNHSEVMANLEYLADVIGPRLSGSAAMRRSNDWTAEQFRRYGLTAALEPYAFGVPWTRGPIALQLVAPFARAVTGHSWAWTVGTKGQSVTGPVVRVNVLTPDSFAVYRNKVKGAWVMATAPAVVWNPDGPPPTAEDSARMEAQRQLTARLTADTSAAAVAARRQFGIDLPYLLKRAGALGLLHDGGKEHALMRMSGSPQAVRPLPSVVVAHEDYAMLDRLVARGVTPRLEARIENTLGRTPVAQWNTVAEIKGTERPGQVVILGAHLDSWDLGTGVTDNGAGAMVVLEAARVLARSGLKPKRTIRFVLFSGEEQGLIGSTAYAAAHAAEADSMQSVLVIDNGTGAITGQALQGWDKLESVWQQLLEPVASLGADTVRHASKSGTDHLSFLPYGVPGFNFDQLPRGYGHTHHSESDTFDKAVAGDLKQASAVMAVTAYELANLPELLPRGPTQPVLPTITQPSAGLGGR